MDPEQHIQLLDAFDAPVIIPLKENVSGDYQAYAKAKHQLDTLRKTRAEQERKLDFMRFEFSEIEAADPKADEDTELTERLSVIQNSELIYSHLSEAYTLLFENSDAEFSAMEALGRSLRLLNEAGDFSQNIRGFSEELSDCYYRIEGLQSDIRSAKDSVFFSPDDLDQTIQRLDLLDKLKRKYGGSIEKVLSYKEELSEALSLIENADILVDKLSAECAAYEKKLALSCQVLTDARKTAAQKLEKQITKELQELQFKDAKLFVTFAEDTNTGKPVYTENGIDTVEFMLVTNKGELPKPLAKIASGGEISRIMLAFKAVTGDFSGIPTMLFDEIDSGISGVTASVVGKETERTVKTASGNLHHASCADSRLFRPPLPNSKRRYR